MTGSETETEAAEPSRPATASATNTTETFAEEMNTETGSMAEAAPVAESEPVAQAKVAPEVDTAERETLAHDAPNPGSPPPQAADQVAVLSSGGNAATSGGFTSFQILLMSGSVIWGFVGTALYFSGKKSQDHSDAHGHHH
jgi:hypothetical protein